MQTREINVVIIFQIFVLHVKIMEFWKEAIMQYDLRIMIKYLRCFYVTFTLQITNAKEYMFIYCICTSQAKPLVALNGKK